MESLMKQLAFLFLVVFSISAHSAESAAANGMKKSVIGVKYFKEMMGNIHQNPSRYSQVLTTISCNHPVKVMKEVSKDGKEFILYGEDNWNLVTVGPYEGYVMTDYLSDKKNECFEEDYSKFFDGLNLDINDLYYWARLYDQYVQGKTKVRQ
jgi:hypothetical protein